MTTPENEFECSDCGAGITRQHTFCPQCGARIEWEAAGTPATDAPQFSFAPMDVGDIFSRSLQIIGKTFLRSMAVGACIFVPAGFFFSLAMDSFYSSIGESSVEGDVTGMAGEGMFFGLGFIVILLAYLAGSVAMTRMVNGEIRGTRVGWQEALGTVVSSYFVRAIGQTIIVVLAFTALFVVWAILAALLGQMPGGFVVTFFMILAMGILCAYIFIRWVLGLSALVCEDSGATESLGRSWRLVGGSWWRTFGIILFMGLIAGFAITLVTAPISIVGFWDFYKEYFRMLGAGQGNVDPEMTRRMFDAIGFGFGISVSLQLMFSALLTPVYTTLLYYDLRARNMEFAPAAGPSPLSAAVAAAGDAAREGGSESGRTE